MNKQFTPTPWQLTQHGETQTIYPASDKKRTIATVYTPEYRKAEGEANALLFLAAPDLLNAIQKIFSEPYGCRFCDSGVLRNPQKSHDDDCGYELARLAAEKATGASSI